MYVFDVSIVIAGYDDHVRVLTLVVGLAGQPAAVAVALAAAWAAEYWVLAVVVDAADVVVVVLLAVVVVVLSADEWDQGRLIKRTEPTTTTARPPTTRAFRISFRRRVAFASAAFLTSRPARCRARFSLGTAGHPTCSHPVG